MIICPRMQNILFKTRLATIVQNLSNKQSAEVICRFDRLRTAHSKSQTSHMNIGKLIGAHAFDYIVLRVNPAGLTSCEDLATALHICYICTTIIYTIVSHMKHIASYSFLVVVAIVNCILPA